MKTVLDKITYFATAAAIVLVGGALAGLGLTVLAFMSVVALVGFGVALLAAPFVKIPEQDFEIFKQEFRREKQAAS